MHLILFALLALATLAAYLAILANWATLQDPTIGGIGKGARVVAAWILPIGVAVAVLRSAAELAPDSLPPSRWLKPVNWLLRISPRRPNTLADEDDLVGAGSSGRYDGD